MNDTFKGRIALDEGGDLEVDLLLTPTTLSIHSGAAEVGSWPLHKCHVEPATEGLFNLVVDDDEVRFAPHDVESFQAAVSTMFGEKPKRLPGKGIRSRLEDAKPAERDQEDADHPAPELQPIRPSAPDEYDEAWVSEDILEAERSLRESKSVRKFTSAKLKKAAMAAAVFSVVGLAAWQAPRVVASVDFGSLFSSDPVETTTTVPPSTTTTTSTTTTISVSSTTTGGVLVGVFAQSSNAFVDSWNSIGGKISPALRFPAYLPAGEFENAFTAYLRLSGAVDTAGRLQTFTLTIDPSGPGNSDVLGINALGVTIAVAEPDLDGAGRKTVLASLGLDVEDPQLTGIDTEVARDGLLYALFFDSEKNLLSFTVTPSA